MKKLLDCHWLTTHFDLSLTVKQVSLTIHDDYSGHEPTNIRMVKIILKEKLPLLSIQKLTYIDDNLWQP